MRNAMVAFLGAAALSCTPASNVEPPLKDWSSAYPPLLEKLPADAMVLAVADVSHAIGRMDAMLRLVEASPKIKKKLEPLLLQLKDKVGWDLFDAKAWEAQGLTPGSMAAFVLNAEHGWLYFRAGDAAKLGGALEKQLGGGMKCASRDGWLVCGDDGQTPPQPPADAKSSLWARLVEDVPAEARKMDVLGFAPLTGLAAKEHNSFVTSSKSAWMTMRLDESEIRFRAGYLNPALKDIEKYLRLAPNTPTVLGAAHGTDGAMRMTFSPTELWAMAKEKLPKKELDQVTGGFAMVTGLDLNDDVINNITGEMVGVMPKTGMVFLFGVKDDKRTARLVEKLDGLMAGGIGTLKQNGASGIEFDRQVDEIHGAKAYHYKMTLPASLMKMPQPFQYELHFAAGKGALVWGLDRAGLESGLANLGHPAKGFLDQLPGDARVLFAGDAPMVGYFRAIDPQRWLSSPMMSMAKTTYDMINPDLYPAIVEMMQMWELMWDGTMVFDVRDGHAEIDYLVRLL